jgi:hypothetical protein
MNRMQTRVVTVAMAALAACAWAGTAQAGPVPMVEQSLVDILGSDPKAVGTIESTVMDAGNMKATVYSQAYTDGDGLYAYLYQVANTGVLGNSPVEMFTAWPFTGADDSTVMGYLSGTTPAGFLSGGGLPEENGYVEGLISGPELSFYYTKLAEHKIGWGQHSLIMYVVSNQAPDQITGNVIDGAVGSGLVVGPIPEPATMTFLGLGAAIAFYRRRRSGR